MLFGNKISYDHFEFYETCARTITYHEHIAPKDYVLEHTKPLFNKQNILNVDNLYKYHSFMEVFKLLKYKEPISLSKLLTKSTRAQIVTLVLPNVNLDKTKQNFLFSASLNWNNIVKHVFERCDPLSSGPNKGIVVPGSVTNSDLSASIATTKSRVKKYILSLQAAGDINW